MSSGQVTPSIGIIGSGHIGAAFARALARAGVSAIANSRGPESLTALVTELGGVVRAGTREEVAAQDIVLVAVPWPNLPAALSDLPEFGGRIVIEANNAAEIVFDPADPSAPPVFRTPDLHGQLSSELLRASCRVRGSSRRSTTCPRTSFLAIPRRSAGVACYFTQATMPDLLRRQCRGQRSGRRTDGTPVLLWDDLGSLSVGGKLAQFPGGSLPLLNLVKLD